MRIVKPGGGEPPDDAVVEGSTNAKQPGVHPFETYSDDRLREFEDADRLTADEYDRLQRVARRSGD